MSENTKAALFGVFLAVLLTIGIAAATFLLAIFAGIDPRNKVWGDGLSAIGVLVVPVFGWPAGMLWIWSEYWDNPKPGKRK